MFQKNQQIGIYTLIEKLGEGGFGEVWLAERRSELVTKKVAVKLPHKEQINIEAIKQEAALWEQASGHANVLPIIDADIYDGQIVIVSEYADGGSLHDKLKTHGKFSVKEACEIIIGVLNGLEFLHERQIIHRDIKPANILFQGKTPRLMDFGISRAMQTTTISSKIIGTEAYMAPESFSGERSVQTDIWSVGVVLFQLLKGSLPFPQEHPAERMFAILQQNFEPIPNDIPQEIQRIITKSLTKLPENRYQTASLMREDLQHFFYGISSTNPQQHPTKVLPNQVVPLINTSPEPSANVSTDQNSVVTNIRVPIETNEAETIVQPFQTQPTRSKVNPVLLISLLLGGLIIGGLGTFFLVSTFTQNNPEVSSSNSANSVNSTKTKKSEIDNSNLNSANENSESNIAENSNVTNEIIGEENTNIEKISTPKPILDKAQLQEVMNSYILGVKKVSDARDEPKKFRKIVYGDIDGDGDEDAVVQFTLEAMGGGNNWGLHIAVFKNNEGKFEGVTDDAVGGKLWRNFDLKSIGVNQIKGIAEVCKQELDNEEVFMRPCFVGEKPHIKRQITITFRNDKLSVPEKP